MTIFEATYDARNSSMSFERRSLLGSEVVSADGNSSRSNTDPIYSLAFNLGERVNSERWFSQLVEWISWLWAESRSGSSVDFILISYAVAACSSHLLRLGRRKTPDQETWVCRMSGKY